MKSKLYSAKSSTGTWDPKTVTPHAVADLRGDARGPNSFNFMQYLGKFRKNHMLAPPGELAPPPTGNPGSSPGSSSRRV